MRISGVVIKESLADLSVLEKIKTVRTEMWEHPESILYPIWNGVFFEMDFQKKEIENLAEVFSVAMKQNEKWYIDFHSDEGLVYVVFPGKYFCYQRGDSDGRKEAVQYGISINITANQLDWSEG
ncbi:MAG: hypothetical protein A2014_02895 [Spirochaetes bacterium GWF1_49_6]|nr:MAG: hypothetical protein A2014_02895 [Spirochaetes bacterium GWF1_49_6]